MSLHKISLIRCRVSSTGNVIAARDLKTACDTNCSSLSRSVGSSKEKDRKTGNGAITAPNRALHKEHAHVWNKGGMAGDTRISRGSYVSPDERARGCEGGEGSRPDFLTPAGLTPGSAGTRPLPEHTIHRCQHFFITNI